MSIKYWQEQYKKRKVEYVTAWACIVIAALAGCYLSYVIPQSLVGFYMGFTGAILLLFALYSSIANLLGLSSGDEEEAA